MNKLLHKLKWLVDTAQYTQFARISEETVCFNKISTPVNYVKFR